jgi:hypothetical protein
MIIGRSQKSIGRSQKSIGRLIVQAKGRSINLLYSCL